MAARRDDGSAMAEWLSLEEAADTLEVSKSTVYRSLTDETRRAEQWGAEGEGWRYKPLARRKEFQVRRTWVERKAGETS
jgi:hypothetical protein